MTLLCDSNTDENRFDENYDRKKKSMKEIGIMVKEPVRE